MALNNCTKRALDMDDCEMNNEFALRLSRQQQRSFCYTPTTYNQIPNATYPDETSNPPLDLEVENELENSFTSHRTILSNTPTSSHNCLKAISDNYCSDSCSDSIGVPELDNYSDENIYEKTYRKNNSLNKPSIDSSNKKSSTSMSCDRYIPARGGFDWHIRYSMLPEVKYYPKINRKCREPHTASNPSSEGSKDGLAYTSLLRNELLGSTIEGVRINCEDKRLISSPQTTTKLFQYSTPVRKEVITDFMVPYSMSPVGPNSQKLLRSPRKATRKISRIPFKVLDAPELQDDFYLNLVDWSSQNVLSVGLGSCVYLWSACTSQVTRLCDLSSDANSVTSVSWNERGNLVAVGTHHGYVQVWDVAANKQITKLLGHTARVGALAWNADILSSGSRDRMILQRDVRTLAPAAERKLPGHRQEVCGLKWSPDNQHLASGGNDNRLYVWNMHSLAPIQTYTEHTAAVKAIAWSPHHHGLLASGGGTADRCIRFWNTLTGQPMQCVDTGSQVCNLAWSKHSSELVSTHGYSQNQILVWKYPTLSQVAKLTGHSYRVLYLAMSPDGEAIVTGAGDETLRFWNVFSKVRSQRECKSVLNLFGNIR